MSRSTTRLARLDPLVAEMYRDYQSGLTLREVGEKYGGRDTGSVYHLFKVRGLPRRKVLRRQDWEKIAATRRARLDSHAAEMAQLYAQTRSLKAVARAFSSDKGTVRYVLERNGYKVRSFKALKRQANGAPERYQPKTDAELEQLIQKATRVCVPAELRFEWRRWSMERRAAFIARMRAAIASPTDRPTTAFSSNVQPFDYGTPAAHAIEQQINAGLSSRLWPVRLRVCSQGVIWRGQLWFWAVEDYYRGPWTPEHGRPSLRRTIWEDHHGRPVPEGHVVRAADGNKNNLVPENLVLATRNDLARENQAGALQRKSRERTALLLARAQKSDTHGHLDTIHRLHRQGR